MAGPVAPGPVVPSRRWLTDQPLRLQMPRQIHVLLVAAAAITGMIATWISYGTIITSIWGLALVVALALWVRTTLRRPLSRRVLPVYVAGILVLLTHDFEQWTKNYALTLTHLLPHAFNPPVNLTQRGFVVIFPFATTVVFLFGAAALFFHHPLGNYCAWLLLTTATVLPLSDLIVGLATGPIAYVPGMWTAPLAIVFGLCGTRHFLANRTDGVHR